MNLLDIGEIARRSGVPPSTLRYYEEIGLISSYGRRGLRRQFDADVLLKLSLIDLGKSAGFSLTEIAGMFSRDGHSLFLVPTCTPRRTPCRGKWRVSEYCGMRFAMSPSVPQRVTSNARAFAS